MLPGQPFYLPVRFVMKIEGFIFQVFADRPVTDDETLSFHQFLFVSAVGAGKSVGCAHKCIRCFSCFQRIMRVCSYNICAWLKLEIMLYAYTSHFAAFPRCFSNSTAQVAVKSEKRYKECHTFEHIKYPAFIWVYPDLFGRYSFCAFSNQND
jgi:hypothetical protein